MAESVPARCPSCRREHRFTAPSYPCVCGAPVAPRLDLDGTVTPVAHRVWQDDWVTVRCASCGRRGEWPRPEVGCPCGAVLRVPVVEGRGVTGPDGSTGQETATDVDHGPGATPRGAAHRPRGTTAQHRAADAGLGSDQGTTIDTDAAPGPVSGTGSGDAANERAGAFAGAEADAGAEARTGTEADTGAGDAAGAVTGTASDAEARNGTETGAGAGTDTESRDRTPAETRAGAGTDTGTGDVAGAWADARAGAETDTGAAAGTGTWAGAGTATDAETSDGTDAGARAGAETNADTGAGDVAGAGTPIDAEARDTTPAGAEAEVRTGTDARTETEAEPTPTAEPTPSAEPTPETEPAPGPSRVGRPPFRSVAIRTALDAVTATALYLRWLGYRRVRRADQRPPAGIGLAARGVVALVDPAVRPATLRDVECLWLTAMTESADCLYFSLAGYADDARARADALGVPLFVLDPTGTPRPVNAPAAALDATGTGNRAP